MKKVSVALLCSSLMLLVDPRSGIAQDTTFVWQSSDGDPFNIQATVVFDEPESSNGSVANVVSLSVTDYADTFTWTLPDGVQGLFIAGPLAWTPSQILQMQLEPTDGGKAPLAGFGEFTNGTATVFDASMSYPPGMIPEDNSGKWVPASAANGVPDEMSTLLLLTLAGAGLAAARRFAAGRGAAAQCRRPSSS